jgi:radical SAM protein with 4Fe4S-binding SPASM domain
MNLDHIPDTIEFVCKMGVRAISLYHTMKAGFVKTDDVGIGFSEYVKAYKAAREVGQEYGASVRVITNFPFLANMELNFDSNLGELANLFYGTIDGRSAVYINYDGSVYPTTYEFGSKKLVMGNVLDDDLIELWNTSPVIEQFRKAQPPDQCGSCSHSVYCRGGPITNYAPTVLRRSHDGPISCPLASSDKAE